MRTGVRGHDTAASLPGRESKCGRLAGLLGLSLGRLLALVAFGNTSLLSVRPLALAGAGRMSRKLLCTPFAVDRPFLRCDGGVVLENTVALPPGLCPLGTTRLAGGLEPGERPSQAAGWLALAPLDGTFCSTPGLMPVTRGVVGKQGVHSMLAGSLTTCGFLRCWFCGGC